MNAPVPQRPDVPVVRLVRRETEPPGRPVLDDDQQRVVDHRGGPLLVLAGPGTGKTTTVVEHVVSRIERDGLPPESVLVLTFSRRAAGELRERVTLRLGRTLREPLVRTVHSYAFGLLRREAALRGEPAPRLLSGAEQDLLVRDLLRGDVEEFSAAAWPERLHSALRTHGFARELRDLLQRAAERGVDPDGLRTLGRRHDREDWVAAADFAEQYAGVTALRQPPALDPAELVRAAVDLLAGDAGLLERERAERAVVVVDEYQDSDPAQESLLDLLAGGGRDLVAVGDPDQSIYAFRGADLECIRRFPERFPTAAGGPAPVVTLTTARRSGPVLVAATRRVAGRLGGGGRHRSLVAWAPPGAGRGELVVHVLRGAAQEAAFVAQRLREAHLLDGVPWSRMAVLVRGAQPIPVLRRALQSAGVPVAVRREQIPLVEQAPVRALLDVLAVAAGRRTVDAGLATDLVCGPLGGADPLALRRLRQELRRHELAVGGSRSSADLLVEALERPVELATLDTPAVAPARRVADLLATGRAAAAAPGATAEDVLWAVWHGSGLAGRWSLTALRGGTEGAAADRDLDAVVALFEAAGRFVDRLPRAGVVGFLDHLGGQQVPADTLAAQAPDGAAVALLTAHAAKGLEWDVVAVAGVQEGVWPDLRPRGSLLGSEALVDVVAGREDVPGARLSALLAEERRLFYVATTRARRRLLVTAVVSEEEEPSRFLDEIDPVADGERSTTVVHRGLDLPALVAELRRAACDPTSSPATRGAAAGHLARLAEAGVPGAAPEHWYALPALTDDAPLRGAHEQVRVSPSRVESYERCPLRWLVETSGGRAEESTGQGVGSLVHELAELAVRDGLDRDRLLDRFDERWPRVEAAGGWWGRREQDRARAMVERLADWLARPEARETVDVERDFCVALGRAVVAGRVDRLERDRHGRLVVVDLKTGRTVPSAREVTRHAQLGTYQLAARAGAFGEGEGAPVGGASLVQLGRPPKGGPEQAQPPLDEADHPGWAADLLAAVADGMAGAVFEARTSGACRRCPARGACPAVDDGRQVLP